MQRTYQPDKLVLCLGCGCRDLFQELEKEYFEVAFAVFNYWVEGIVIIDIEEPETQEDNQSIS